MSENVKPTTDVKRYLPDGFGGMRTVLPGNLGYVHEEDFDAAIEDSARAENAQREAERIWKEVCADFRIEYDDHPVGIRSAIIHWMANTKRALTAAEERIVALQRDSLVIQEKTVAIAVKDAEERARVAEAELNRVLDSRLEGYRDLGRRAAEAENRCDVVLAELHTLRRSSVRVDVLLRWMDTRSWNMDTCSDQDIEDLRDMLTRRSLRKENDNDGR